MTRHKYKQRWIKWHVFSQTVDPQCLWVTQKKAFCVCVRVIVLIFSRWITTWRHPIKPVSGPVCTRLLVHLPACIFVGLPSQLEIRCCDVWKMINKMYALSRWMWLLSHGDVTFQQEARDETLSEDFVPPGCMAECWEQGCWPKHHFNLSSSSTVI